jgi:hypothetical protein
LYFALAMLVALVGLAAISHCWGDRYTRKMRWGAVGMAVAFTLLTQWWSDSFVLFIVYEAVMMTVALALYATKFFGCNDRRGFGLVAIGIIVSLIAAIVDTQTLLAFDWVWTFDCHGIFHLIQMPGVLFLFAGVDQLCGYHGPENQVYAPIPCR